MSDKHQTANNPDQPTIYQIRVKGHLDDQWTDWFGEVSIEQEKNGDTLITCPVIDQAALFGMLKRVRDLGISLISINQLR